MTGFKTVVNMVEGMMETLNITVPVALHLDHGSYEGAKECIEVGFTSVMFDGSHYDIEENVQKTKDIVERAKAKGVSVEAEVGSIGGEEDGVTGAGEVADIFEAIEAGIKLLTDKRKRQGAKVYVASDLYQAMAFARDTEGRFLHNPINGVGIESLAKFKVEEDPFLKDGDFVIGNSRFYKLNWNEPLMITRDSSGKQRINDYTGFALCSGKAEPNSFVYGKK